jgi:hypothetical protein
LLDGDYTAEVINNDLGCSSTATVIVANTVVLPSLIGSSTPNTNCLAPTGSVSVAATTAGGEPGGGYTYNWLDASSNLVGSTASVTNLPAGNYSVTVGNNDNLCESTTSVIISDNTTLPALTPSSTPNTSCSTSNGSVSVNAITAGGEPTGGYSYDWRDASSNQVGTTASVNNLPTGSYTVTVTNNDTGCLAGTSASVSDNTVLPVLTPSSLPNTSCQVPNGSVTVSASTPGGEPAGGYTYDWRDGSSNQIGTTASVNNLIAGNYTVTVINNTTSCSANIGASVSDNLTLPTMTLGASPSVEQGVTTATLPYTATTGSPTDYQIDFDATAQGQGFADVSFTTLPASPINITVPVAAATSTYNGLLSVRNTTSGCVSSTIAFTVTITTVDVTQPTVAITSSATSPTNTSPIPVTITFSEIVTGFIVGDIAVTNGTAGGFTGSGTTYTANIAPTASGIVTVNVAANVAVDAASNNNTAATAFTITFDNTAPTVSIASAAPDPTNLAIPITITFSEATSNFVVGDITVTNGTANSFSGSGTTYTATIIPTNVGLVSISITAGAATDPAGNGNTVSNTLSRTYDNVGPTVTIASTAQDPTNLAIPITITFNESTVNFVVTDITVTNGSVGGFTGSGTTYSALVTPTNSGPVTVVVTAGKATDATGNNNTASNTLSRTFDNTVPTVVSINRQNPATATTNATSLTFRVTFSEAVTGVAAADFTTTLSGVTVGAIAVAAVSTTVYDVTVGSVSGNGTVRLDVSNAATIADVVGNNFTGGFTTGQVFTVDTVVPVFSATTPASNATAGTANVSFTLSEALESGTITWTRTGGTSDPNSPRVHILSGADLSSGAHANVAISTALVSGAIYSVSFAGSDLAGNAAVTVTNTNISVDSSPPTVVSISFQNPVNALTNATSVTFRVVFSEAVTNVDASDFTKTLTGVAGGAITVTPVSATTYDVSFPVSGSGTIRLDVLSSATIIDAAGSAYTSNFITGPVYNLDQVAPVFSNITPNPTSTVTGTQVGYTLSENLGSGTITWTRTGGTADTNVHIQNLSGTELNSGAHPSFLLTNSPTLVAGTVYSIAFSGTDLAGNNSQVVTSTNITYHPPASQASDIIANTAFSYPQNIDYILVQEATDIQNSNTSVVVAKFDIRDGGSSLSDVDPFSTIVTGITLDFGTNFAMIRRVALYDDGGNEINGGEKTVNSQSISFSDLNIECADNNRFAFSVRMSFEAVVTDNTQFSITITQTITAAGKSAFAAADAGGATTSTSGDNNKVEVRASKLLFVQQPANTFANEIMTPAVSVEAVDANDNRDVDFSGSAALTSSGTMANSPTASLSGGVGEYSTIVHTVGGTALTLTASSGGFTTATSLPFDIYETISEVPIVIRPIITPTGDDQANNVLYIENIEFFPSNTVRLLDRWGVPVKVWNNFANYLNTTAVQADFDFSSLNVGSYVCIVEYTDTASSSTKGESRMVTVLK